MNLATLEKAAAIVRAGGVVAYPTEGCYGLGCDPRRHAAVRRILRIKRRSWRQGLILIAAGFRQLKPFIDLSEQELIARARDTWPGPVTWLLPAAPRVSPWLRGEHSTIAVRITAHPVAATLCRCAGTALVSTSANRHGHLPARSAASVQRDLGAEVDRVITGRLGSLAGPTEIRDARRDRTVRTAARSPAEV